MHVKSNEAAVYRLTPEVDALSENEVIERAEAILRRRALTSDLLSSPEAVRRYLRLSMSQFEREVFVCVWLTAQHQVIGIEEMFRGTLSQTSVYTREVVKSALKCNAGGVIFAHNHPSGVAEQSHADEVLTKSLKQALALVDVKVLDHFIVAGIRERKFLSFAERGLI